MCIIASLDPGSTITEKEFDAMWDNNKDGGGIVSLYKGAFTVEKSLDRESFKRKVFNILKKQPDAHNVIHFRMANIGDISLQNCHPFKINKRYWMAHNGTISGTGIVPKHKENKSDTYQFSELLSKLPWNFLENPSVNALIADYLSATNKVAFLDRTGSCWIYGRNNTGTVSEKGRWFSNSSFRETRKAAVNQQSVAHQPYQYNTKTSNYTKPTSCMVCKSIKFSDELWDYVKNTCSWCSTEIEKLAVELECDWNDARKFYSGFFETVNDRKAFLTEAERAFLKPPYIDDKEWDAVVDGDYELAKTESGLNFVKPRTKSIHDYTEAEWAELEGVWK